MNLKQYNLIQTQLFTEYNIIELAVSDTVEFFKICSLVSCIKSLDCNDTTEYNHILEITRDLISIELYAYNN